MDKQALQLRQGLAALDLHITQQQQTKLLDYVTLLVKWNAAYNLTAIKEPADIVVKHILDSLAVLPYISAKRLLDVGTGAGLPGIPLAICQPNMHVVLLDSQRKKLQFVQHVAYSLPVPNVTVVNVRMEAYHPSKLFDAVISRAVGSIGEMLPKLNHLCCNTGSFLFMKGNVSSLELAPCKQSYQVIVTPLNVPYLQAERHLIQLKFRSGS